MITEYGTDVGNGGSYRVKSTKTGHAITRTKRHIKPTNISAEDYLWNEMAKANQTLATDGLNKLNDHFTQFHKK